MAEPATAPASESRRADEEGEEEEVEVEDAAAVGGDAMPASTVVVVAAAMTVVVSASAFSFLPLDAAAEAMEDGGTPKPREWRRSSGRRMRPSYFFTAGERTAKRHFLFFPFSASHLFL